MEGYRIISARYWNGDSLFYSVHAMDGRVVDHGMTKLWNVDDLLKKHKAAIDKFEATGLNRWGQDGWDKN